MSLGSVVRHLLGPYEAAVSDLYRGLFVSLPDLARQISDFRKHPVKILEVGCGEGAMTAQLSRIFPDSHITAIDILPTIGRLYHGKKESVSFRQQDLAQLIAEDPSGKFDLVVMVDVLHHVAADRLGLLADIRRVLADSGGFVLKDLDRGLHPVFLLAHFADYYITGDRNVKYHNSEELYSILVDVFGAPSVSNCRYVKPWKSNVVFFVDKDR